ncbi:hypothetical protein OAP63_09140 [Vibrio sp.]|uniref:NADH dehydrogenase n=1 Tax=Vibrio viridaestus TaxID=2487322 RepID=A0A3N9TCN7_9VIBR|nr:hypothetical protein [Vibrio viridaestus]MDC0610889.1 hypothetical protein [Vibrio sp.]RQW61265.1 hypothetical protein EES38_20310 [Vibrio viridaestus]
MLARYMGMTPKQQSYLFTFGLALTVLGMVLTDMWVPMVVGAIILTGLTVEAWIRTQHLIPMHNDIRALKKQVEALQHKINQNE